MISTINNPQKLKTFLEANSTGAALPVLWKNYLDSVTVSNTSSLSLPTTELVFLLENVDDTTGSVSDLWKKYFTQIGVSNFDSWIDAGGAISKDFANFGVNPSIIAADADQNTFFLSDATTGGVLSSVSLAEFGAPSNGSGFIGFDKSGNATEYSDGELPRTWDGTRWLWMTDPAATRSSPLDPENWQLIGISSSNAAGSYGDITGRDFTATATWNSIRQSSTSVVGQAESNAIVIDVSNSTSERIEIRLVAYNGSTSKSLRAYVDTSGLTPVLFGLGQHGGGLSWTDTSVESTNLGNNLWLIVLQGTPQHGGVSTVAGPQVYIDTLNGTGTVRILAAQHCYHEYRGLIGGDQTVGNVDREALEWLLGARGVAAIQAATDLTVGVDFTETGGAYTSGDIPGLLQIGAGSLGNGDGLEIYVLNTDYGASDTTSSGRTSSSSLGKHGLPGSARLAIGMTASAATIRGTDDGDAVTSAATNGSNAIDWSDVTGVKFGGLVNGNGSWNRDLPGGINKLAIAAVDTNDTDLVDWSGS